MPPFKLRVKCDECCYRLTGWYPGILMKADKHAGGNAHSLSVFRMDGRSYCNIPAPNPDPETW